MANARDFLKKIVTAIIASRSSTLKMRWKLMRRNGLCAKIVKNGYHVVLFIERITLNVRKKMVTKRLENSSQQSSIYVEDAKSTLSRKRLIGSSVMTSSRLLKIKEMS